MKRTISAILILCIVLVGAVAFAETAEATRADAPLRLNHSDIERLVRRDNPTVRNNAITAHGLNDMMSDDTFDTLLQAQGQLREIQRSIGDAFTSMFPPMPPDAPPPPPNPELDPIRGGVAALLQSDMVAIEMQIRELDEHMMQVRSGPARAQASRALMQINHANMQITWGVESLFLGYHTLSRQLDQTRENLETMNRNIEIMERRQAVGHITARALQSVRNNRTQLEAGIASMENELANLRGQMNLMLGRNVDAPLQIGVLPTAERDFIDTIDRTGDLRAARRSNPQINIALSEISEQAGHHGDSARRTEAIAQNNYDSELRAIQHRHEGLIRTVADREVALELAEEQLELLQQTREETQRRFERGLVSRVELESAQSEVTLQEIRVASADAELFGAIRRYEWFVRGLNI